MNLPIISWNSACAKACDGREFITIGSSPYEEECWQIGNYAESDDNMIECKVLAGQLIRIHGQPPPGAEFILIRNDHECGIYLELGMFHDEPEEDMDPAGPPSLQYALKCATLPDKWDEDAIRELSAGNHSKFVPKEPAKVVKHQGKVRNIKTKSA